MEPRVCETCFSAECGPENWPDSLRDRPRPNVVGDNPHLPPGYIESLMRYAMEPRVCETCRQGECLPDSWPDVLLCKRTSEVVAWDYSCDQWRGDDASEAHDVEEA